MTSKSIRVGGNEFDDSVIQYIKSKYNLMIGERTAEDIKINIGSVFPGEERITDVKGRDLVSGLPKTIQVSSKEIREALKDAINTILDAIKAL